MEEEEEEAAARRAEEEEDDFAEGRFFFAWGAGSVAFPWDVWPVRVDEECLDVVLPDVVLPDVVVLDAVLPDVGAGGGAVTRAMEDKEPPAKSNIKS